MNNKKGLTFAGQSFLVKSDSKCFRIKLNIPANLNGKEWLGMGEVQSNRPITRYIEKVPKSCRLWNLFLFTCSLNFFLPWQ
ncbi:hypothetical protein, partial [Streptococcus suis]|uniref:hypothetical protein n=1 Tax=Streptococcus suis TaxID=1307 RepID=UPI001CE2ABFE